ncbi:YpoC family protein [Bacillus sp. V5-8f]|uniref:YpoC family protein n=1 Tax=Bacillus sp. V5-8f TaxID=2053044 RepID=UPI000C75F199|nr:hypothetical protein [Bacillus sp. V5-8f]PLT34906.1 hypothetical protein CUU64_05760 [Bacillus sp. V5-8f]
MRGPITCSIPEELKHPLFFSGEDAVISPAALQDRGIAGVNPYFAYELLYWNGLNGYRPWEADQLSLVEIFSHWKRINQKAGLLFSDRKAEDACIYMIEGLSLFFSALFWLNNKPVSLKNWEAAIESFPFKPVNTSDRLSFIFFRPGLYHSYVQLAELFAELEKLYYKKEILSKKTSKHQA